MPTILGTFSRLSHGLCQGSAVRIVAGTPKTIPGELMAGIARFRYRLFVELLGWELGCSDGLELDQFDREDTLYLVAHDGADIVGIARVLPTHRPYLLRDVFPQLMGQESLPNDPAVWELSRFGCFAQSATKFVQGEGHVSSAAAVELLHAVLRVAAENNVRRIVTVSPLGVERLLRRAGFIARRAGPPMNIGGQLLFACWIEVPKIELTNH